MDSNPPHLSEKQYRSNPLPATPHGNFSRIWRICILLALARAASAQSAPWAVVSVQQTFIPSAPGVEVMTASGDLYSIGTQSSCTPPTLTIGNTSIASICVAKTASSGQQVFSYRLEGVFLDAVKVLAIDQAGNVDIVGGYAQLGFSTTPGAYEPNTSSTEYNPWYCQLSGVDGHLLFCTHIDVVPYGPQPLATDSAGNAYFSGFCVTAPQSCYEKLNAKGDSIGYLTQQYWTPGYIAVDSNGHVAIAAYNAGLLARLDAHGAIVAMTSAGGTAQPTALAFDTAGDLQVVFQPAANQAPTYSHVFRYTGDLSAVLYDTSLNIPSLSGMSIDSSGATYIWGVAGPNLAMLHPTQPCDRVSNPFLVRLAKDGTLLQSTYLAAPSSARLGPNPFPAPGGMMFFRSGGATLAAQGANWEILNLGPVTTEINLTCVGSAASFTTSPLAPNELVSLFWTGIDMPQGLTAAPNSSGVFPSQLGGVHVTFDGVPAPMLYADSAQINLVTPGALQGENTTHVCAVSSKVATNCIDVPVQAAAPDIFGVTNSGDVLTVFLTGLGAMTPAPADGSVTSAPLPKQVLTVQVIYGFGGFQPGYHPCTFEAPGGILYAGPAPTEVEGLSQINFSIPGTSGCFAVNGSYFWVQVLLPDGKTWVSSRVIDVF